MTGAKIHRVRQPKIEDRRARRPDACRSGIGGAESHRTDIKQSSLSETRLSSFSAQLLRAQEAERARVSRKLHDEFGQALGVLKLRIGIVRKQLRGDQDQLRKECDDTIEYLNQIIEDTRNLAYELCPSILEDFGLVTALRRLVAQFTKLSRCKVISRIEDLDRRLPMEAEVYLYRIVQAALTNIEQHALARNVSVILEKTSRHIRCFVEDDGCGFDRAEIAARSVDKAMGLAVMSERARMMGASLDLVSRKRAGTRICVNVPIEKLEGQ
jgi:signal transduction histidine kinase